MTPYNGSEFNSKQGVNGGVLKFIWLHLFPFFNAISPEIADQISAALANYYTKAQVDTKLADEVAARNTAITAGIATEATARQAAIQTLQDYTVATFRTAPQVATQITSAIDALVAGAPQALDTLKEISDALTANGTADTAVVNALNALTTVVGNKASQADLLALQAATTALQTNLANNYYNKTESDAKFATVTGLADVNADRKADDISLLNLVKAIGKKITLYVSTTLETKPRLGVKFVTFTDTTKKVVVRNFFFSKITGLKLVHISATPGSFANVTTWDDITSSMIGGKDKTKYDLIVDRNVGNGEEHVIFNTQCFTDYEAGQVECFHYYTVSDMALLATLIPEFTAAETALA
jgi:hypothetical protein